MGKKNNDSIVNIFEWMKMHSFWTVVILLATFIFCMLFIQIGYWIGIGLFTIKYENALLFLGSFLTFIGTMFLGIVSYVQNSKLSEKNEELENRLNKERIKAEKRIQEINLEFQKNLNDEKIESEERIQQIKIDWDKEQQRIKEERWYNSVKSLIMAYKEIVPTNAEKFNHKWLTTYLDSEILYDYSTGTSIFKESFKDYYKGIVMINNCKIRKQNLYQNYKKTHTYDQEKYKINIRLENTALKYFDTVFEIKALRNKLDTYNKN